MRYAKTKKNITYMYCTVYGELYGAAIEISACVQLKIVHVLLQTFVLVAITELCFLLTRKAKRRVIIDQSKLFSSPSVRSAVLIF